MESLHNFNHNELAMPLDFSFSSANQISTAFVGIKIYEISDFSVEKRYDSQTESDLVNKRDVPTTQTLTFHDFFV